MSCELVRRRALVTRISAGVSSHREVGEFSPESNTSHGINTLLLTTRLMGSVSSPEIRSEIQIKRL